MALHRSTYRPVAAALSIVTAALFAAGCSGQNSAAIGETPGLRQSETLIATYAATHDSGSGVGTPAGCEARIIGQRVTPDSSRQLYLELLCSSLTGHPPCPRSDSTAFITEAVATVSKQNRVTALTVDNENDAGEYQWVVQHFPAQWRHVEHYGPKYGALLQSRLQARFRCE